MAAIEKTTSSRASAPLVPPEERFWIRYSPHYELPLAGATSFFVHGVVVGILAVGGLAFLFKGSVEASKPPEMDVLLVEDGGGLGGFGGDPGLPGMPGELTRNEVGLQGVGGVDVPADAGPPGIEELPSLRDMELEFPPSENATESKDKLIDELKKLGLDAANRAKDPTPKPANPPKGSIAGKSGAGGPKGDGGQGGAGGNSKGPGGPGKGGPGGFGRKATEQEIKAWRWRFDLTGTPKEHADKLDRAGLLVAVPDPRAGKVDPKKGPHQFIRDLKRRPVMLEDGDFAKYEDAVKWYNSTPDSVRGLAQELNLKDVPAYVVLLLPKDREKKMAAEEKRFAVQNRNDPARIQETWFDFRLQNGVYEPVAIKQR
jgi:hypothetical protein